jgi:metacaspase-1
MMARSPQKPGRRASRKPSGAAGGRRERWAGGPAMPRLFAPPVEPAAVLPAGAEALSAGPGTRGIVPPLDIQALTNGGFSLKAQGNAAPDATIKVLGVHGIGDHHTNLAWKQQWALAIAQGILAWRPQAEVVCTFIEHDRYFSGEEITLVDVTEATASLLASTLIHGVGDLFRARGLSDLSHNLRWSAGMVAQWAANERLRAVLRRALMDRIVADDPHVICGHSLGSLVAYDTLIREPGRTAVRNRIFVSLGSQIGNPAVRRVYDGVLVPLPEEAAWFHLYNRHDSVFTTRIDSLRAANFQQVETHFDDPGFGDHSAVSYFSHPETSREIWARVAGAPLSRAANTGARTFAVLHGKQRARRRALLVGINDYPDPRMRLAGCMNDIYLTSAVLQEIGFQPEDIRAVFNDRATAGGIRDRLHWLLDDARPGDSRVFYYSGHGAQLETYSLGERVDRKDECLVPYDFDWSLERAVVDDWLYELYSQLDHQVSFFMVMDCCHSGGMIRGGPARVRGIDPPDDVLHRGLYWDRRRQMWAQRGLRSLVNAGLLEKDRRLARENVAGIQVATNLGITGDKSRLGRGSRARAEDRGTVQAIRRELGHNGPYQPLIYSACAETEYSWEYRHGSQSYGAFTYALSLAIRQWTRAKPPTFTDLLKTVSQRLRELDYEQTPGIFGPRSVRNGAVPWLSGGK